MHHFVGVVHASFRIRQRCFEHPRIWKHAKTFVDESFVPQCFERPHDAFHVGQVECLVVIVEIHPARLASYIPPPVTGVLQHRAVAVIVEFGDAKIGDGLATRDTKLPFGLSLSGQAVAVPPESTLDAFAAHRAIPRDGVFDKASQQVAVVRQAISKGGPVIKHELCITVAR